MHSSHPHLLPLIPAQALGSLIPSSATFRKCLRELRNICGDRMILPASYACSSRLIIRPKPFASGGHGDVYQGTLDDVYQGTLDDSNVCVKRLRVYAGDDQSQASKVCRRCYFSFRSPSRINSTDILQGSGNLETLGPPKHSAPTGCHNRTLPAGFQICTWQ